MAFALCPPADVPNRKISAMAAFLSASRLVSNASLFDNASFATSTKESISKIWFESDTKPIAGSNSKAPMHRFPKKQSVSTGFAAVRPVRDNHLSNNARPYVSGSASANIPGRPLKTSLLRFPNE